jgi:hypothetical protein
MPDHLLSENILQRVLVHCAMIALENGHIDIWYYVDARLSNLFDVEPEKYPVVDPYLHVPYATRQEHIAEIFRRALRGRCLNVASICLGMVDKEDMVLAYREHIHDERIRGFLQPHVSFPIEVCDLSAFSMARQCEEAGMDEHTFETTVLPLVHGSDMRQRFIQHKIWRNIPAGQLETLIRLWQNVDENDWQDNMRDAAMSDQLAILQYLFDHHPPSPKTLKNCLKNALCSQSLGVLEWLLSLGERCPKEISHLHAYNIGRPCYGVDHFFRVYEKALRHLSPRCHSRLFVNLLQGAVYANRMDVFQRALEKDMVPMIDADMVDVLHVLMEKKRHRLFRLFLERVCGHLITSSWEALLPMAVKCQYLYGTHLICQYGKGTLLEQHILSSMRLAAELPHLPILQYLYSQWHCEDSHTHDINMHDLSRRIFLCFFLTTRTIGYLDILRQLHCWTSTLSALDPSDYYSTRFYGDKQMIRGELQCARSIQQSELVLLYGMVRKEYGNV